MDYRKTVEHLRRTADTFIKSGYAVDGIAKCFEESADTIEQLVEELKQFKDKQEQGLLIELKVPLGTPIWYLAYQEDFYRGWWEVKKSTYSLNWIHFNEHKKLHLTESEAEEALAKMGGK